MCRPKAYQNSGSEAEKKGMLAGLSVKTEGKERRVGPDISARMYRSLTAENPQLVVDWSAQSGNYGELFMEKKIYLSGLMLKCMTEY